MTKGVGVAEIKKSKGNKKLIIAMVLIAVFLGMCSYTGLGSSILSKAKAVFGDKSGLSKKDLQIHDPISGSTISLGMKKSEVDKLLGEGELLLPQVIDRYRYKNNILIEYKNDEVVEMMFSVIGNPQPPYDRIFSTCTTCRGIGLKSYEQDVLKSYNVISQNSEDSISITIVKTGDSYTLISSFKNYLKEHKDDKEKPQIYMIGFSKDFFEKGQFSEIIITDLTKYFDLSYENLNPFE